MQSAVRLTSWRGKAVEATVCLALLALCLTEPCRADVFAFPEALGQLSGQAYSIKVRITVDVNNGRSIYYTEEFHSSWQKKSKIEYHLSGMMRDWQKTEQVPRHATIYADDKRVLLVDRSEGVQRSQSCRHFTHEQTRKMFLEGALTSVYRDDLELVGPSRMLRFIYNNLNNLQQVDPKDQNDPVKLIADRVQLRYNLRGGGSVMLYYSENPAGNPPHGVPPEMHLYTGDTRVIYEFQRVKLLPESDHSAWFADESGAQGGLAQEDVPLAFDLFSIDRAAGCSGVVRQSAHDNLLDLAGLDRNIYRFSFNALPMFSRMREPIEMSVAFEPSISTLRAIRTSSTRVTENTINFAWLRRYHVVKRRFGEPDKMLDKISAAVNKAMDGQDQVDDSVSCVMTRASGVRTDKPLAGGYKLGDMLFGSTKFVYLGRAKVRGIDALAFEASNSKWPVWFQPPSFVKKDQNTSGFERPQEGFVGGESKLELTTVIYLSASVDATGLSAKKDFQDPVGLDSKLLLMEVFKFYGKDKAILEVTDIPVFDFSWHIAAGGLADRGFVDFFLLGDDCLESAGHLTGKIDMLLKLDYKTLAAQPAGWLNSTVKRNLALMRSIHDTASIPAVMVYDLNSRFELYNARRQDGSASLSLTMRISEHVRSQNELVYLFNGAFRRGTPRFVRFNVYDFYACHMVAAHFKLDTVFAFDPVKTRCYVYAGNLGNGDPRFLLGSTIDKNDKGPLEIYQITPRMLDNLRSLVRARVKLGRVDQIELLPIPDDGHEDADMEAPAPVVAALRSFKLTYDSRVSRWQEEDDDDNGPVDRLVGFGLAASSDMNALVVPEQIPTEDRLGGPDHMKLLVNEMTFSQCQAVCMFAMTCRSFSFCIRAGQAECVLSRVNFRDRSLQLKLKSMASLRLKFGETFALSVPEEPGHEVSLRIHPTCELHNKNFLDLCDQKKETRTRGTHDLSRFEPVEDREECAKMCFETTLRVIKEDARPMREHSRDQLKKIERDGAKLHELLGQHSVSNANICTGFLYLDPQDNDSSLAAKLKGTLPEAGGYCALQIRATRSKPTEEPALVKNLHTESHELDFSLMYEKHYGLAIRESELSVPVSEALWALQSRDEQSGRPSESDLQALRDFVERGDNKDLQLLSPSASECAKYCFLQIYLAWPACKSFGYVREFDERLQQYTGVCYLHSVTLRETLLNERADLIKDHKSDVNDTSKHKSTYWHYEPKPNLVDEAVDWSALVQTDHDLWSPRVPTGRAVFRVHFFVLLICVAATLLVGVNLGLVMGRKLLDRMERIEDDTEGLIDDPEAGRPVAAQAAAARIEFINLASCQEDAECEGKIETGLRPDDR